MRDGTLIDRGSDVKFGVGVRRREGNVRGRSSKASSTYVHNCTRVHNLVIW